MRERRRGWEKGGEVWEKGGEGWEKGEDYVNNEWGVKLVVLPRHHASVSHMHVSKMSALTVHTECHLHYS